MASDEARAREIAGTLSPKQRASFLRDTSDPKWSPPMWIRAWNTDLIDYIKNPWGDFLVWTPLGLAVRAILMEESNNVER